VDCLISKFTCSYDQHKLFLLLHFPDIQDIQICNTDEHNLKSPCEVQEILNDKKEIFMHHNWY